MASTGHRHNIMYPTFEWLGVGIAANANGDYWITQVFVESGR
ncbi:MAG: CAP domain-containing protein [Bacteroidota bacterium]